MWPVIARTLLVGAAGMVLACGVAVGGAQAYESATVETEANLRAEPNTTSLVLAVLASGTAVDVECWAVGEATYGADQYGSMWLYVADDGWVHSFLVTPVDVPQCQGGPGVYEQATVEVEANLRAEPNTTSPILSELPAGSLVEVACWAGGEATYGDDVYGSMWLAVAEGGWVHSFLLSPVEVPSCVEGEDPGLLYENCDEVRAAGAAPITPGVPGYGRHLDRDGDGVGCELE